MTDREALTFYRLTRNPRLWAFMVLAGAMGLDRAVAACAGDSSQASAVLAPLKYTVRDLPTREEAGALLLAARVLARWVDKRNQPKPGVSFADIALALGASRTDVEYAVVVARRYGWREGAQWQPLPIL